MSISEQALRPVPQVIAHEIVQPRETKRWVDWVTTTDHKKIGIMYLVLTFVFFMLGGVEALMMRLQLSVPNNTLLTSEHYNQLLTMHGTTMVFLFVVPVFAGLLTFPWVIHRGSGGQRPASLSIASAIRG